MVITINARNVNDAYQQGYRLMKSQGEPEGSRNGPVLRVPEPVTTVYRQPCERVLFDSARDANPFFHLVEAVWMLAGRDDLKQLTPYAKNMSRYSDDDGVTQPAAYGKRWRDYAGPHNDHELQWGDQLNWVVNRFIKNPLDRRVVIQMWDPIEDPVAVERGSADVPCNITALPWIHDRWLHLTVLCRSNDMIWGAYGANAVHFSILLEYLAGRIGLEVGTLTQVSNNFHAYVATMPPVYWPGANSYSSEHIHPFGLLDGIAPDEDIMRYDDVGRERVMREDLLILFEHGVHETVTKARWPWLRRVVVPMMLAHEHWRKTRGEERYLGAYEILDRCAAPDWRAAGREWIARRHRKWQLAVEDGVSADA